MQYRQFPLYKHSTYGDPDTHYCPTPAPTQQALLPWEPLESGRGTKTKGFRESGVENKRKEIELVFPHISQVCSLNSV